VRLCLSQTQQFGRTGGIQGAVDEPGRQQRQRCQRDDGQDGREEEPDAGRQAQ